VLCLFVIVVIVVFVCYCCVCLFVIVVFVCYCFFVCVVCGVMVSVLSSSVIVGRFEPRSCQTRDYKIDISCFSAKHAALRRKIRLVGSESGYCGRVGVMSIRRLLF
jgi:hypothetical protein